VLHASSVAQIWNESDAPLRGITLEVLLAAACFVASAGLVGIAASNGSLSNNTLAVLVGWPIFGLAGGIVLDQRPHSSTGRVLVVLALMPALVIGWAEVRFGGLPTRLDIPRAVFELTTLQAAAVAIAMPWAFRRPVNLRGAQTLVAVAAVGAIIAALAEAGSLARDTRIAGWALVGMGCAGIWLLVARAARTDRRGTRRRVIWVMVTLGAAGAVLAGAWTLLPSSLSYAATTSVFALTAFAVVRLVLGDEFRPLAEHLLDLLLVAAVLGSAALTGLLAGLGAHWAHLPSARTSAAFTALVTAAMAVPAAFWARRTALARRYGTGLISPADVAVITADLHAQTEPRDLLDKAARMVAAASGSAEARIVLGDDAPSVPEHWSVHPLDVGGDRVGFLAVQAGDPEGPEPRQEKVVAQLLPTVALVARAVGLAVEAEHARRDVARERDAERKRVLGDLHDGLGPVLAGMSMRVQAALRTAGSSAYAGLLTDLAGDLAASRTDLRRIVAGITPSTLDDGDLDSALHQLVQSFGEPVDGPRIRLEIAATTGLSPDVKVAVYRSVAEGVTNALRHAAAATIDVRVRANAGVVRVDVVDDGGGGPVVPGVGLSSLAQRASSLGGCLHVTSAEPTGTRLQLELPTNPAVEARP
jgi:signal transduction histidine kinase